MAPAGGPMVEKESAIIRSAFLLMRCKGPQTVPIAKLKSLHNTKIRKKCKMCTGHVILMPMRVRFSESSLKTLRKWLIENMVIMQSDGKHPLLPLPSEKVSPEGAETNQSFLFRTPPSGQSTSCSNYSNRGKKISAGFAAD